MNRTICVDGVCSRTLVATRGITAGSGNAAAELKLLPLPLMILLHQNWAVALIAKIYVDDLTLIVIGSASHVIGLLSVILNFVIQFIEEELKMTVSRTKSRQ